MPFILRTTHGDYKLPHTIKRVEEAAHLSANILRQNNSCEGKLFFGNGIPPYLVANIFPEYAELPGDDLTIRIIRFVFVTDCRYCQENDLERCDDCEGLSRRYETKDVDEAMAIQFTQNFM